MPSTFSITKFAWEIYMSEYGTSTIDLSYSSLLRNLRILRGTYFIPSVVYRPIFSVIEFLRGRFLWTAGPLWGQAWPSTFNCGEFNQELLVRCFQESFWCQTRWKFFMHLSEFVTKYRKDYSLMKSLCQSGLESSWKSHGIGEIMWFLWFQMRWSGSEGAVELQYWCIMHLYCIFTASLL